MQTKSPEVVRYSLARLFGSTVKGFQNEFKYLFPNKKSGAGCSTAPSRASVIPKEVYVAPVAPKPAVFVIPEEPVQVKVERAVSAPRVEVEPVVIADKPVRAPVFETKSVSRVVGLQGIEFANKAQQLEAEIYFRDLQSASRGVRLQALREIKKLSRPVATGMLEQLLSTEKDTLQIIEIMNALASICEESSMPKDIFKKYSGHQDSGIRLAALRAISKYHDEESFSILTSCMKDKTPEVRRQMLNCLCWTFSERCLPYAINALHDSDPGVRKAASQIVGTLRSARSISGLITLLSDPDGDVQASAAVSLKKITNEDFGFKPTASKKHKDDAIEGWRFWWRENQTKFARSKV